MRKIKFRQRREWFDFVKGHMPEKDYWHYWGYIDDEFVFPIERCKSQQYTELKDKNSKEIYEGDILKLTTLDRKEHYQDIYFKDGAFRIRTGFDTPLGAHIYKKRIIAHEVIGNIHETPELLK